ncbi:MAG: hypothetical protein WD378_02115 [Egicoccus sp.]
MTRNRDPRRRPRARNANFIESCSHAGNVLTIDAASRPAGMRFRLPDDMLGHQLAELIHGSVARAGHGGSITSLQTVRGYYHNALLLHELLVAEGIGSLDDASLDFASCARVMDAQTNNTAAGRVRHLLREGVDRFQHPNLLLHRQLKGMETRVPSRKGATRAYPDAAAQVLEEQAREVFGAWLRDYRALLGDLGIDVSHPEWVLLTPEQIEDRIRPIRAAAVDASLVDLTEAFLRVAAPTYRPSRKRPPLKSGSKDFYSDAERRVIRAMYVGTERLQAAEVLLTIWDNQGHNDTPLKSIRATDIRFVGDDIVETELHKGRGNRRDIVVSNPSDRWSFAGVAVTLRQLTCWNQRRRVAAAVTPAEQSNAALLFVGDGGVHIYHPNQSYLAEFRARTGEVFCWRRVRKTQTFVKRRRTNDGQLSMQSRAMADEYEASGGPEEFLGGLVTDAQDDIVRRGRDAIQRSAVPDEMPPEQPGERHINRGPATCTTGVIDPETDDHCNRGLVGCFSCPSARITRQHAAGLTAAVRVADAIKSYHPQAWAAGDAWRLEALAQAALEKLRSPQPDEDDVAAAHIFAAAAFHQHLAAPRAPRKHQRDE